MTRGGKKREKIVVLGTSFALFLGGAAALSLERGGTRTCLLALSLTGLLAIAAVQTVRNLRKKRK